MKRPTPTALVLALSVSALACLCLAALSADAEQSARAGIRVSFDGSFAPNRVPRHRLVPISLTLEGSAHSKTEPSPRLRQIEIAFGARGGLDTAGLPLCERSQLRNATRRQALARCRGALVGHGEISAEVPFNSEQPFVTQAGVLIFNGRTHGKPAAWVQAYSSSPPVSFVLPFFLRRPVKGTYGVLMRSPVGSALGPWPRLRSFRITLGRRYPAGGRAHSYLSAHCPLAPRLTSLSVPFARATYRFAPHTTIVQPIRRFCTVSRERGARKQLRFDSRAPRAKREISP
jgi:hypothetical protein